MKKILIISAYFIIGIFGIYSLYALISVEDVFDDIENDYIYYEELNYMYDKGIISTDTGNWSPQSLIIYKEAISIAIETSCKKCIIPNTSLDLIKKYNDLDNIYDIKNTDKKFYCIASAEANGDLITKTEECQNEGGYYGEEKNICFYDNITKEEGLKMLLDNSVIFDEEYKNQVLNNIKLGVITENLGEDVLILDDEGNPNEYYPYFKKALEYKLEEIDENLNVINKNLMKLDNNNKLYPDKYLTKEEFINMAYIILKTNGCQYNTEEENIAIKINLLNESCEDKNCELPGDLNNENQIYDFSYDIAGVCDEGIIEENNEWYFYNKNTGKYIIKYGDYINNFDLGSDEWIIKLLVKDRCDNIGQSSIDIDNSGENYSVFIESDKISGEALFTTTLEANIGIEGNELFIYKWIFGDGNIGNGKIISHSYGTPGIYKVILEVEDNKGIIKKSHIGIEVLEENKIPCGTDCSCGENTVCSSEDTETCSTIGYCKKDTDGDKIYDDIDKCVDIYGDKLNNGCPLFYEKCDESCGCDNGYTCSIDSGVSAICTTRGICLPDDNILDLDSGESSQNTYNNGIIGNITCKTCPCEYSIDYNASIREGDILFPAITSPDETKIYSKGSNWTVSGEGEIIEIPEIEK